MFRAAKTTKPRMKSKSYLKMGVLAKKEANIANATKEYMPEHATSTAKFTVSPAAFENRMVGAPYAEDSVSGSPAIFNKP